jgi:2-hydroxy-3-keto-5-methylthiopentenyl-1-phosphate phosphatase
MGVENVNRSVEWAAMAKLAIFCDFDETITEINVTDTVLEKYAAPAWLEIQEDWLAGKLSAREVLEKQMPLITVGRTDLDDFIDTIQIDPFFADFARFCARESFPLYVLSDGFDYWIKKTIERALSASDRDSLEIPVFACNLKLEGQAVSISFPYFAQRCSHGCATCKPGLLQALKAGAEKTVVIGDGVSDFLVARSADVVLAKNGLAEFCDREGIRHYGFKDFHDVMRIVGSL